MKIHFLLAKQPALQHLSQRALHKLSKVATVEHHRAGDFVCRMGEPCTRVYLVERGACKSFSYTQEDLKFFRLPHLPESGGEEQQARDNVEGLHMRTPGRDGVRGDETCRMALDVESEQAMPPGHDASTWRNPGDHHEEHQHHFEVHTIASAQTTTSGLEKHHFAGGYDSALHSRIPVSDGMPAAEAEQYHSSERSPRHRRKLLPHATPHVTSTEAGAAGFTDHYIKRHIGARPLLYSASARSMLELSGLAAECNVKIQRRGATTLDSQNWVDVILSSSDAGLLCSKPCSHTPGPLSMCGTPGIQKLNEGHKHTLGMLREVRRVEEFSLGQLENIARIEFLQGHSVCVCFDEEAVFRSWVKHLRRFRDEVDSVIRAFTAQRTPVAIIAEGEMFGSEEMQSQNQFEAQSSTRRCTVLCERDTVLLVLPRMDFLTIVTRSPVFGLQDRIAALKSSGLVAMGDHARLFRAARSLLPVSVQPGEVVCRAGMQIDAVYIVFRGFASVCDDVLDLNFEQDSENFAERGSTYISSVRKVERLGFGEAFGDVDVMEGYQAYQHTLIADGPAVLWHLPLQTFLDCTGGKRDIDGEPETRAQPVQRQDDVDPRQVPRKVGSAANILEQVLKTTKSAPSLSKLLDLHVHQVPAAPVSTRGLESSAHRAQEEHPSEALPLPSGSQLDVAICTKVDSADNATDACEISPISQDETNGDKVDVLRRQFRVPPQFRTPRKPFARKNHNDAISIPKLDLTHFIKRSHVDDQDDDELGFEEFDVSESCRDVVRSLRKVAQYRAPRQRTTSQYIKDLVLNTKHPSTGDAGQDAAAMPKPRTQELILRIDGLADGLRKSDFIRDSIRYTFRALAIAPGGILVYADTRSRVSTVFVKFDRLEDLHSGLSQALRLGMRAQESTVNELATYHVLYQVQDTAKSLATPTSSFPLTARGSLQGSRLSTANGIRAPRVTPSTARARAPQCQVLMPDLTAVGTSRPWTAPTSAGSPLLLPASARAQQHEQQRPGSMQISKRITLRQERPFTSKRPVP